MTNKNSSTNGSQVYSCSVVGKVRDHNEDAVLTTQWSAGAPGPLGCDTIVIVADGMGGHERGEWASQTALKVFMDTIAHTPANTSIDDAIKEAIDTTNMVVFSGAFDVGTSHPGTTFTVAAIRGNVCTIGHVGDSRLYLLRDGQLKQITEDHSWAGELMRQGKMTPEQAANWVHKNQITRAIGIRATVEPAFNSFELQRKDVLLLCSDGLSGMITDEHITNILNMAASPGQAGDLLCEAANTAGGEDNISTVLYAHEAWPTPRKPQHIVANPRTKTLPGNQAMPNGLSPHHRHMSKWIMILLAIGVAVVLSAGIYLVLNQPKPAPPVLPPRPRPSQPPVTVVIPKQLSASLQIVWDKANKTVTISANGAEVTGIVMKEVKDWDSPSNTYKLSDKEEKELEGGSVTLKLEGIQDETLDFQTANQWSLPIETDGEFTLKLKPLSKPEKILGKFSVKIDTKLQEN